MIRSQVKNGRDLFFVMQASIQLILKILYYFNFLNEL